jgi:hypothetical protein
MSDNDSAKAQEILTRRDANGQPLYDHVRRGEDGQLLARRASDHTREDRVS